MIGEASISTTIHALLDHDPIVVIVTNTEGGGLLISPSIRPSIHQSIHSVFFVIKIIETVNADANPGDGSQRNIYLMRLCGV